MHDAAAVSLRAWPPGGQCRRLLGPGNLQRLFSQRFQPSSADHRHRSQRCVPHAQGEHEWGMPMNNDRAKLERRRFLRAVGASALTYPFVRGLPSYAAAATEPPRYLILLFSPTGFVRHLWGAPGAKPGATPTVTPILPGTFRPSFTPLEPLRQKVIVLDGLANQAAMGPVLPDATQHETGMASLWTGVSSGGAPASA